MLLLLFLEALGLPWSTYIAILIMTIELFVCFRKKQNIVVDLSLVFIAIFSIFYVFFNYVNGYMRLSFVIHPIMYYLIGSLVARNSTRKKVIGYIFTITWGMLVHVLLTYLVNGSSTGRYMIMDVWTGQNWNATGIASCLVFSVSLMGCAWKGTASKVMRILICVQVVLSLLLGLWCGSRTLLAVGAITLIVVMLIINKGNLKYKKELKEKLGIVSAIIVLVIIAIGLYNSNFAGIASMLDKTTLFTRFTTENLDVSDTRRYEVFVEGIAGLVKYPFGGNQELHYAHNLWLDVGRQAGIVPMFFLLAFYWNMGKRIISFSRRRMGDPMFAYLVGAIFVGFTLDCAVEPIMNGMEQQFLIFLMIMGLASGWMAMPEEQEIQRRKIDE